MKFYDVIKLLIISQFLFPAFILITKKKRNLKGNRLPALLLLAKSISFCNGIKKYQLLKPPERPAVKDLKEISVPAHVLVGEFDIPDVHAHSVAIESGIPGAKRKIVMNAGHSIPVEQPEKFNRIVTEFLVTTP